MARVSCGYLIPYEDVIGVGGSGKVADTAIVLRATYPATLFDKDLAKRLEVREVIAMLVPRSGRTRHGNYICVCSVICLTHI